MEVFEAYCLDSILVDSPKGLNVLSKSPLPHLEWSERLCEAGDRHRLRFDLASVMSFTFSGGNDCAREGGQEVGKRVSLRRIRRSPDQGQLLG